MFQNLLTRIRSRTRSQWINELELQAERARSYLRANPEKGALIGLIVGILLVLFFELIAICFAFAILVAYFVWYLAPERLAEASAEENPIVESKNVEESADSTMVSSTETVSGTGTDSNENNSRRSEHG